MTNKAPDRIWAVTEPNDVSAQILGDVYAQQTPEGMVGTPVEYVRSDLHVKVKPLEWNKAAEDLDCDICDTFGMYQIADEDYVVLFVGHSSDGRVYDSVEEAKAAAQADYEQRILARLNLAPVTPAQATQDIRKDVDLFEVGQSAIEHLLDRRGLREPLQGIKYSDPDIWEDLCRETADAALRAIAEGESE